MNFGEETERSNGQTNSGIDLTDLLSENLI